MINIIYKTTARLNEREADEEIRVEGVLLSEAKDLIDFLRKKPDYSGAYVQLPVVENEQVVMHNLPVTFPNL